MCTIDAHGNSSNLSMQFNLRIRSEKNKIYITKASDAGAPKQYPNYMMTNRILSDSMPVSGAKKMTVYYEPDTWTTYIGNNPLPITIANASSFESVSSSENIMTPLFRIQVIDMDSQKDNTIDIYIDGTHHGIQQYLEMAAQSEDSESWI